MRYWLAAWVVWTLIACRTAPVNQVETVATNVLLPPDQERQLGERISGEIEQQEKLLNDPVVNQYVKQVGQRVGAQSPNPDQWKFTFKVIDKSQTVNAFAIPGGTIYVYSGLIAATKDQAELAGVLAHEVAHVTSRHVARRMVDALGLQAVAALALGQNPSMLAQVVADLTVQGALLKNSRDDEAQADSKGVVAASRAGYDPQGIIEFFQTLQKQEGNTPKALTFLSDHPATADRINALQNQIREQHLTGANRNQAEHDAVKSRIR